MNCPDCKLALIEMESLLEDVRWIMARLEKNVVVSPEAELKQLRRRLEQMVRVRSRRP